jgi:methylated-DNA-[protein]-cysteine S-methyltransferase
MKETYHCFVKSPIGDLILVASDKGLQAVHFDSKASKKMASTEKKNHPILQTTAQQIKEYFSGARKDFDVPLAAEGTPFQHQAWRALLKIPYGKTISYQAQASRLGDIKKARAVGTANSRNPIAIIVPCHRVIAKNGSLSGYAGGVNIKTFLLEHELRHQKN